MDLKLIKNTLSLIGIQGANFVIPLITLPYLVRVLEPIGYGNLGLALAIVQYFSIITDYGFNLSITQKIAIARNDITRISEIYWAVFYCKIALFLMCGVILLFIVLFFDRASQIKWLLFSCFTLVMGTAIFPVWLFQGKESMVWIAISNISAKLLAVPLIFLFVTAPSDAWIAGLITGITAILAGVISLIYVYKKKWILFFIPSWLMIKNEFRDGWHIFISTAAISLYTTSTTVILGIFAGPIAVGYYVAADKIRQAVQGLISPISQAFYPRINATMAKNKISGFEMIRKLLFIMIGITFISSAVLFFCADFLIHLAYGDIYENSASVLKWLAWLPLIIACSNVFGVQTLLVLGHKKLFSRVLIFSGLFNVAILSVFSYVYQQNGAAVSIFITELLVTITMLVLIIKLKIPLFKRV
ncbi:hypothetical protein IW01_19515 [Pectobacterium brasiliense]|uniref:flippase n=1 Tax=Pectobacterium brasiliense TaxID=180957 RepID=UPI0004E6EA35|nr:flippase [Pectobacterium brasiliense]KFF63526.1 hypothetical protein IW01_19515 [Pectobacterium brasiliense]